MIISPPEMHDHLRTVIVAPMTTANRPARLRIPGNFRGKTGLILLDQIRTIDKQRLVRLRGEVTGTTQTMALEALRRTFED